MLLVVELEATLVAPPADDELLATLALEEDDAAPPAEAELLVELELDEEDVAPPAPSEPPHPAASASVASVASVTKPIVVRMKKPRRGRRRPADPGARALEGRVGNASLREAERFLFRFRDELMPTKSDVDVGPDVAEALLAQVLVGSFSCLA